VRCLTNRKTLHFGADPDYDSDTGIFLTEFLSLQDMDSCKNFASICINNDFSVYHVSTVSESFLFFCCLVFVSKFCYGFV